MSNGHCLLIVMEFIHNFNQCTNGKGKQIIKFLCEYSLILVEIGIFLWFSLIRSIMHRKSGHVQ
jgi:hypothetical protein